MGPVEARHQGWQARTHFPAPRQGTTLAKLEELAELTASVASHGRGASRSAPTNANLAEADRNRDKPKEALKSVETEKTPEAAPAPEASTDEYPESQPSPATQSPAPSPQPPVPAAAAESPKISIEDFAKVEMRTGEIKTAEPIPGAKKLLKLTVDIGTEVRQVCAGIAEFYAPEKLIGMKVVVVTNLQPRKLRGVESNGMIVAASIGDAGPARAGHLRRRRAEWGEAEIIG